MCDAEQQQEYDDFFFFWSCYRNVFLSEIYLRTTHDGYELFSYLTG